MFSAGQKVVCIRDEGATPYLKKGSIYTVLGPSITQDCVDVDCPPANGATGNRGWLKSRFRPIQERKTDISIFTEILRKHSLPADQRKFETASAVGS